ncbi:MAG: NADH-quinone oxidoreductase subunit I [Chloroflexi bacterium]|nr:NADH-quinone oxidoreductase subunit I [Chloroflexota bacterium]
MYGIGIAKGMLVTIKHLFRRTFTVQYPEERLKVYPRYRGQEFVWYEERCTGCATCAKYCPLGIIKIVTHPVGNPAEGFDYYVDVFDIEIARCMFCGLCVEACPYDALFMGTHYEMASYTRQKLVINVDQLKKAKKQPSAFMRPHLLDVKYEEDTSLTPERAGRMWQGRWAGGEKPAPQAPKTEE